MTKGQVNQAERRAKILFDEWNDVTGFIESYHSQYGEITSIIEDSVHIGIQMALFGKVIKNAEGDIARQFYEKKIEPKGKACTRLTP